MNLILTIVILNMNFKTINIKTNNIVYKKSNEVIEEEKNTNEDTVSYVDKKLDEIELITEKDNLTEEDKKIIKKDIIEIKDFILNDVKINGKSFSDLDNKDKKRILNLYIKLDKKIEKTIPNYKYKLKVYSKNEYNKISKKAKEEINNYVKTAGEEKINNQKSKIKRIAENIKNKINNWLKK